MVTLEANWNIDFLRIWVLETITRRIVSIPPPHPVDGLNRISWAPNFKGNFSVKSAYWSLKENHWNPKDPMWKSPWNFKESTLNVLRDCLAEREVWRQVIPSRFDSRFFTSNISDWLISNLQSHKLLDSLEASRASLIGLIASRIWKNINLFVFQGLMMRLSKSLSRGRNNFEVHNNEALNRRLTTAQRNSLSVNWIHLHADGAVNLSILDGLTILQDRDFNKISIHTNSLEDVHALQRSVSANSNSALVRRIQQRLRNFEHWVVRHVSREANIITDRIAKMVVVDMEGVNVLAITLTNF
ncbi:hypothetical protein Goshw_011041 [Gossypium schwendimanii]|uniref:RNase H type-1 domain-containing protein n=1 Tax=Gossypium schwendimanii TaxID=34291 RepID=A0A7J9MYU2_GOSSC|nr:hypothetical protein [Gossypium schwendimanii]